MENGNSGWSFQR